MIFKASDFKTSHGEHASPQAAADIANARLARLFEIYRDDTSANRNNALHDEVARLSKNQLFPGKFDFEKTGSAYVSVTFVAKDQAEFLNHLRALTLSSDIDFVYHPEVGHGEVFVGGYRSVGVFKRSETDAFTY